MAQALSEDEFQRMQAQLLELRTQNYQLADELRKQNSEVSSLRLRCTNIEKDLAKAQKAIAKSKKAQEVEALLSENEMLQGKLHSQEDDFRLQNTTLMQELSKLCSQIEELEGENKRLSGAPLEGGLTPAAQPTATGGSGELLRLQAENTALQRNLAALQQRLELEVEAPQRKMAAQDGGREGGPQAAAPGGDGAFSPPDAGATDAQGPSPENVEQLQSKCAKLEQKLKEFNEMGLRWEMEREEKRLLKEQLQSLEASKQSELNKLQEEASKVSEKLKKKQESFLHLQAEKEALYNDSRTKITEIQQKKEEELKSLSARNQRLQTEVQVANQNLSDLKDQIHKMESEHNTMAQALREQVVCQGLEFQEQMDSMLSENDALRTGLAALEQIQTAKTQEMNQLQEQVALMSLDLRQRQGELEERSAQRDQLLTQLQGASEAKDLLLEQSQILEKEVERLREELEESAKLAEKRKAMLDELAIERQQDSARHQEALSSLRLKHDRQILAVRGRYERELRELHDGKARGEEALREQLRDEKARNRELETLQAKVQELGGELEEARTDKESIRGQLQRLQELMERTQREHEERTQELQREHALELQAGQGETQRVREELCLAESQRDECGTIIGRLQQEIKDTVDGQRILEKKGSSALKDLKRQLQLERRRADKLQERLQDFLTNTRTRSGLDDFVLGDIGSPGRNQTGDSSSVSSFSLRDTIKDATGSKSTTGSPQSQRPADLSDDEVSDLFQRLAEVQQEKWMLEEKVKHLEVSCSSMADDLCRKSSIIETYVMDSRIDVTAGQSAVDREREKDRAGSFGSVLRDLVKPGDENVREMNKKLQNMLEEQLTKNMHLQKDLEVLSQELVRLSKGDVIPKLS